jgi:hypothetical protein
MFDKRKIKKQIDALHARADEHSGKARSAQRAGLEKKAAYHENEFCRLVGEAKELKEYLK